MKPFSKFSLGGSIFIRADALAKMVSRSLWRKASMARIRSRVSSLDLKSDW